METEKKFKLMLLFFRHKGKENCFACDFINPQKYFRKSDVQRFSDFSDLPFAILDIKDYHKMSIHRHLFVFFSWIKMDSSQCRHIRRLLHKQFFFKSRKHFPCTSQKKTKKSLPIPRLRGVLEWSWSVGFLFILYC